MCPEILANQAKPDICIVKQILYSLAKKGD